jgi:hypothetical protein
MSHLTPPPDDLLYVWLVLLNQYVTPVPLVANTTKGTDAASLLWCACVAPPSVCVHCALCSVLCAPLPPYTHHAMLPAPCRNSMIRHCGRQIMDCVGDKTCKAGLDCLEGCEFNDQVCQYRYARVLCTQPHTRDEAAC